MKIPIDNYTMQEAWWRKGALPENELMTKSEFYEYSARVSHNCSICKKTGTMVEYKQDDNAHYYRCKICGNEGIFFKD